MDPRQEHSDDEEEEEEDARELKLPKVFTTDPAPAPLNNSMVALILQRYVDNKRTRDANFQLNPMLKLAMEYATRFAITKNAETAQSIATMLDQHNLEPFEQGAIANLCPEKAEEARALVPSIFTRGAMSDDDLQQVLDDMAIFRDNQ